MALVACKECGKEVSKKAEACPHCGFKPKRTSLFTWIVTIFVGIPILISVIIAGGQSSSSEPKTPEQMAAELASQRATYARIIAEQSISKQLKAPSTADFSGYSETQVAKLKNGGPNDWIVMGFVDAQNDFGAKLRNNYQVVIEFEANKHDSYRVTKAELFSR
jgi:hypothetical protein